jgi:hypothetical protein
METIKVKLPEINLQSIKVTLEGKSPLLMDRMSDEIRNQILEKQTGVAKSNKKAIRDIAREVDNAIHKTKDGTIGFPAAAVKMAMMECTSFVGDKMFSKKLVSGAVRIVNSKEGLLPVKFKKQDVLKHYIGPQTKFSPQFHDWSCDVVFRFDANSISAQDIVTLVNHAGFYAGLGAWRPKCREGGSGEYGTFAVKVQKG